jgi:hypothetical protein
MVSPCPCGDRRGRPAYRREMQCAAGPRGVGLPAAARQIPAPRVPVQRECGAVAGFGWPVTGMADLPDPRAFQDRAQQRCRQHPAAGHECRRRRTPRGLRGSGIVGGPGGIGFPARGLDGLLFGDDIDHGSLGGASSDWARGQSGCPQAQASSVQAARPVSASARRSAMVLGSLSQTERAICSTRGSISPASVEYNRAHILVVPATSLGEPNSTPRLAAVSRERRNAGGSNSSIRASMAASVLVIDDPPTASPGPPTHDPPQPSPPRR